MGVDGRDGADQPRYLNVRETARRLAVHENTVRNWVREGILPSARVPGSKFHRFDDRDVENLRRQRGAVVAGIAPQRRMIGPELVDASQLSQWAATAAREAQSRFPELVRRLLVATSGVTNVSVRAGDGVSAPGWDGRAESDGTAFLPPGSLVMEFGVGASPKAKADADYAKRRDDPLGVDPSRMCFVFVTPRRWPAAEQWADARRREHVFADVRVIDADDLEGWLQATPVVHHWISEQLGRRPEDAETLERWWERFSDQTQPSLPSRLFVAGRERQQGELLDFLGRPADVITIKAMWKSDAIAFTNAAILHRGDERTEPPAALVITSRDAWTRVTRQAGRMTLLPLFARPDIRLAVEQGHHVVLCSGNDELVHGNVVELPRPSRDAARGELEAAGVNFELAYRLSALARRSMPALVRKLSRDPRMRRPDWAQPSHARILAPLLLVGSWATSADDVALVSQIVGEPWPAIERELRFWRGTDDPPFVRSGDQWHLASPDEAFLVLHEQLSGTELQRWRDLALAVLLELDPLVDLPENERLAAGFQNVRRQYSGVLSRGVASGVALLGASGSSEAGDAGSGTDYARLVVREILGRANVDQSGRIWRSLSDVLPLLAEGAPDAFLDAVDEDLRGDQLLGGMFQDNGSSSWLYSSSPHSGLLWALETLCWSPAYLRPATLALARLQVVDPGGRLANRPLESLSTVLVGWIRHTSAALDLKVRAVADICRELPAVGWPLLLRLLPTHHAVTSPPTVPRYNDWMPESRSVTLADWTEYIGHLVGFAVELAGVDPDRWASLAESASVLPPTDRNRVLDALAGFCRGPLSADDRLVLWERIHKEVSKHRQFPDAEWSMDQTDIRRLEQIADSIAPTTAVERFAYLFDWRPDLPEIERTDFAAYETRVWELRNAAVKQTLDAESLDGLGRLADRVTAPSVLGSSVGMVADDAVAPELAGWLDTPEPKYAEVAAVWAARRLDRSDGIDWLRSMLERPELEPHTRRIALVLRMPPRREFWDALRELDPDLLEEYWRTMHVLRVPAADLERALTELITHDRPWLAIDLAAAQIAYPEEGTGREIVDRDLVTTMLDAALRPSTTAAPNVGYEVGVLLDYLAASDSELLTAAQYEFAFFRLIEHHRAPRALYKLLRDDSNQFVALVSRVYRGKTDRERVTSEEETRRAHHAWWVLSHWNEVPGVLDDGTIDAEHLQRWVQQARLAFAETDRADIGDQQIGQVLAASPPGADGVRPAEAVREIIETIGSTDLEEGYVTGVINSRGVTSRGVFDGGRQERELAARYRLWAEQTRSESPRTSRVLRRLAENYDWQAREEDARAEISADTE